MSVSSVRAATVTPQLGRILAKRGSKSLTIAIESGSERMREVVNKKLSHRGDLRGRPLRQGGRPQRPEALRHGGPAHEDDADIEATADLLLALKKATPGLRL